jgi:hypothetical protein
MTISITEIITINYKTTNYETENVPLSSRITLPSNEAALCRMVFELNARFVWEPEFLEGNGDYSLYVPCIIRPDFL